MPGPHYRFSDGRKPRLFGAIIAGNIDPVKMNNRMKITCAFGLEFSFSDDR
jgi:hypothetical protein